MSRFMKLTLVFAHALAGASSAAVSRHVSLRKPQRTVETSSDDTSPKPTAPFRVRLENRAEGQQYYGMMSIGGQPVRALFDTGSFEILVLNEEHYHSNLSKTFRASDQVLNRHFAGGGANTILGYEEVKLGPVTSVGQAFQQVTSHAMQGVNHGFFDVIVGLGPENPHNTEAERKEDVHPMLLENLHLNEYSLCMQQGDKAPGWLTFGGDLTAEQKTSSAIVMPVIGQFHWSVALRDVHIGKAPDGAPPVRESPFAKMMKKMGLESSASRGPYSPAAWCADGCTAILDSGTSLISGPAYAIRRLKHFLPKLQSDCSNFDDLPDIEMVLGGHKIKLTPDMYVAAIPEKGLKCVYAFLEINTTSDYGPVWILGMPFFRHFHTTFSNAPKGKDRKLLLMDAGEDCKPKPLKLQKVPGAEEPVWKSDEELLRRPNLKYISVLEKRLRPMIVSSEEFERRPTLAAFDKLKL